MRIKKTVLSAGWKLNDQIGTHACLLEENLYLDYSLVSGLGTARRKERLESTVYDLHPDVHARVAATDILLRSINKQEHTHGCPCVEISSDAIDAARQVHTTYPALLQTLQIQRPQASAAMELVRCRLCPA